MSRRRKTLLIGALAAVVVLWLLAFGFFPQELLRGYIERRLQEGLGPGSSVRRMRVVPGRLRTEVEDLVIEGPTYRLTIPRARLQLAPAFLWGDALDFRSIEMESPSLEMRPAAAEKPYKPLRKPLIIRSLTVTGGRLAYEIPDQGVLSIDGIGLTGSVGLGHLDLSATGGRWARENPLPLGPTQGRVRISSQLDLQIDRLETSVLSSRIRAAGSLGRVGQLEPDVRFDGRVDLRDLERAGLVAGMRGEVDVEGTWKGLGDRLHVDADASGTRLAFRGWSADRLRAEVSHQGTTKGRTKVVAEGAFLGGQGNGVVEARDGEVTEATLRVEGVDLAELRRRGLGLDWIRDGRLSGTVEGRAAGSGVLRVSSRLRATGHGGDGVPVEAEGTVSGIVRPAARRVDLAYDVRLETPRPLATNPALRDLQVAVRGHARGALPPVVDGTLQGSVRFVRGTGAERIPLEGRFRYAGGATTFDAAAQALGGRLTARGDLRGSVARRLEVHGQAIDVALFSPDAQGLADVDLLASGPLDNLSGTGSARVADLLWQGGRVGPVSARLTGRLSQARFTAEVPELQATAEGTLDRRTLRARILLQATPLDRLQPFLPAGAPVAGQATGALDVTMPMGRPRAAVVEARLESLDVTYGGRTLRAAGPFAASLRSRRVAVQGVRVEGDGLDVRATGSLPLDPGGRLEGTIEFDVDLTQVPPPAPWTLTGGAQGRLALSGTRAQPRALGQVTLTGVTATHPRAPQPIQVSDAVIELLGEDARIQSLHATVPGGSVDVTGLVPLAALIGDVQAARLGLRSGEAAQVQVRFDVDLAQLPQPVGWTLAGRTTGDVSLQGTLARPRAFGSITLSAARVQPPQGALLGVAEGSIELQGDRAVVSGFRATVAEGTVLLTGKVPVAALLPEARARRLGIAAGEEADLQLTWEGVQVKPIVEAVRPDRPSRISAVLGGEARLHGTLTTWRQAHGEVRLAPTQVRIQDLDLEVEPWTMRLDAGRLSSDWLVARAQGTVFRAAGEVDLAEQTFEATGHGDLDLRALSPLLEEASITGLGEFDVDGSGPLRDPTLVGSVRVKDGTLRVRDIRQPLTAVNGLVTLRDNVIQLEGVSGTFGGGRLEVTGGGRLEGLALADVRVGLKGDDLGLRYPVGSRGGRAREILEDLKARIDVDLTLTGRTGDFLLAGAMNVERSLYDSDIFWEEGILAPDTPPPAGRPGGSRFLQTVGLNIAVTTEHPLLVRNNLAQLEAEGSITLRGSADEPAPFGRFEMRPGGKAQLQGREFTIESGSIIYAGTTNPTITVRAAGLIKQPDGDIEVTVVAEGPLELPRLRLQSNPPLSEGEIASLIATGRTNVALSSGGWVVGEQAAALLAGRFTRAVARELLDLGLDQVDIQPELLAREGELSARFTFGKQLTRNLRLIYSNSLSDPESQYYQALFTFRPGREVSLRAQRRFDGTYTYGAGQRLRFGGPRATRTSTEISATRLEAVRFEADLREYPGLNERVKASPEDEVTYWDLLDDADRLREFLVREGHLEAVVDARLDGNQAVFSGSPGPKYTWRVEGMDAPPDLDKEVREALFEEEALERGRERLIEELHRRGFLRAQVDTRRVAEGVGRTLVFKVDPGVRITAQVSFPGATALKHGDLIEAGGGLPTILERPRDAEEGIEAAYREKHYLLAKIGPTRTAEAPGRVDVVIPVEEGPVATVAAVRFPGSTLPPAEQQELAGIPVGSSYDPIAVSDAVRRLRERYLTLGYPSVQVRPTVHPVGKDLEVVLTVNEGQALVVGSVEITGLRRTSEGLVRKQIDLKPGEPLDPRKLAVLERRLLELGVFRRVVVTTSAESPAQVKIELEEDHPYQAAYDVSYNDDEQFSAVVDGEVRNLFGQGMAIGARYRFGLVVREVRGSFHTPSLWAAGDLTASAYQLVENVKVAREIRPVPQAPAFEGRKEEYGFQIQEALHRFHPYEILYGYRFKRTTCPTQGLPPRSRNRRRLFDPCELPPSALIGGAPPVFPMLNQGAVDLSLVRDTRDSPLNPTRGAFMSLNLQGSPKVVGSDFDFVKEFVHLSFVHEFRRKLVWAHGYRLGLIHTFGGERLPFDELFKGGGPNSLRGFAIDSVGPLGPDLEPLGGEATIVLNQELRYHHPTGVGLALFYDAGNVFSHLRDFEFKFRHDVGIGLRYDSVIGLLRLDVAVPLDRKKDLNEPKYRLYFGVGQAF
jgi:outer membrane protein assembly factor BamA/autotransporter translocation and assembly factor TamB